MRGRTVALSPTLERGERRRAALALLGRPTFGISALLDATIGVTEGGLHEHDGALDANLE